MKLKIVPNSYEDSLGIAELAKKESPWNVDIGFYWYLDGELQKKVGCDQATIINLSWFPEFLEDILFWTEIKEIKRLSYITRVDRFIKQKRAKINNIIPVEILGISEECIGFFWTTDKLDITAIDKNNNEQKFFTWRQRGLVCLKSDIDACRKAERYYKENRLLI